MKWSTKMKKVKPEMKVNNTKNIFLSADHHFSHANIIRYTDRPFADVEEMDLELVRRWNEVVSKDDTVFY